MKMKVVRCLVTLPLALSFFGTITTHAQTSSKQPNNTIVPFHSVNGFMPGLTRYSDVARLYGPPEEIEVPKEKVVAGITTGGNRIIHYRTRGISFLLTSESDAIVEAIYVEPPYDGRTSNGLFLGMKKSDAIRIIERDYHISLDLGESLLIAKSPNHTNNFQVWFGGGMLTRMKLFSR
jgi:hypothetical protein